jgi:hypothetical protein
MSGAVSSQPRKSTAESSQKARPPAKPTKTATPAEDGANRKTVIQMLGVFGVSFALHVVALLVMAFVMLAADDRLPLLGIVSSLPEPVKQKVDLTEVEIKKPEEVDKKDQPAEIVKKVLAKTQDRFEIDVNDLEPSATLFPDPKATAPAAAAPSRGYFGGRSKAGRAALVAKYGGTKESEGAVRDGLEWLARHQRADGSWSFDHRVYKCTCKNPGKFARSKMGATAMALLCFLGAGHTYADGDFPEAVEKGLLYILKNGKATQAGGDYRGDYEGNSGMYIQGLVTIALCEALAMNESVRTQEYAEAVRNKGKRRPRSTIKTRTAVRKRNMDLKRRLKVSRQLFTASKTAVYFVAAAQNTNGGWRYEPNKSADTSVSGWQVMALASAYSAHITVDGKVIHGISSYLDSVGTSRGDRYGYVSNKPTTPTMTAVGLLCRMYLGWTRGNPGIRYGVQYLSQLGPSRTNMYYNYYATQVMHQYGGQMWTDWNKVMRDRLVSTQRKKGHAKGSWDLTDPHGATGGRLYQTCLSIMTLEVYYRHMPLYEQRNLDVAGEKDSFAKTSRRTKPGKGTKKRGKPAKERAAKNKPRNGKTADSSKKK